MIYRDTVINAKFYYSRKNDDEETGRVGHESPLSEKRARV